MCDKLKTNAVALQLPIGSEDNFVGVVDLITMQAVYFDGTFGQIVRREAVPAELQEAAEVARAEMIEAIALVDETLFEKLSSDSQPTVEEIRQAIRRSTIARRSTPVLMGSAGKNCAIQELLDAIAFYLPAPTDRQVWAIDLRQSAASGEASPLVALSSKKDDPCVAMAYKTVVEDFGPVTYIRVYQGSIEKGQTLINARTGKRQRFVKLVRMHADRRTEIDSAVAGDLCGVIGLDSVLGETYSAEGFKVALESIDVAEPVLRLSIEPQSREDSDQLVKALDRFRRQDPTFRFWNDAESGQMLIAGMGQLHLEVYLQHLQDEYDCKVHVGKPQVAFKERPTRSVSFERRLKKQNGGPGQFAQILGRLEVLPMNSENNFEFSSEVSGGRISPPFIQAVREGIEEALTCGPLAGFPVVGVRIVLEDGFEHEKDSCEMSFHRCAWEAMREVVYPQANMELLEPVVQVEVEVPSQFQGGTVGNLSRKRANISSSNDVDGTCRIIAHVPLAEMLDYANELRSQTQGKGTFSMTPSGYQSAPKELRVDTRRKDRAVDSTN